MLWWRPERGEAFGYRDGWSTSCDAFYFSGTGQVGDQRFEAPNAENGRVRDHVRNGDALRLVKYVGKNEVVYLGRLELDRADPWRWRDAPDRYGTTRKVIEFRLLPVGDVLREHDDPTRAEPLDTITHVPVPPVPAQTQVESLGSVVFEQVVAAQTRLARRHELELVHAFKGWLEDRGAVTCGLVIPYAPERRNLRADLYLPDVATLVEAKASASRESVRTAIGQLLDYRRWIEPRPRLCLLVPTEVPPDMVSLLDSLSIGTAWPGGPGFVVRPEGLVGSAPDTTPPPT
jgi:hypothetical protein